MSLCSIINCALPFLNSKKEKVKEECSDAGVCAERFQKYIKDLRMQLMLDYQQYVWPHKIELLINQGYDFLKQDQKNAVFLNRLMGY